MTITDTEGDIQFTIDYMDQAGNAGTQSTATTDGSAVTFDRTDPLMTEVSVASNNAYDNSLAKVDDQITVTFVSNEIIQTPTVLIGGDSATVSGNGTSWNAVRIMNDSDTEGSVTLQIDYMDLAGNSSLTSETTDTSSIIFDRTIPDMVIVSIESNNIYDESLAKVGDSVFVSFTSSESVQLPTVLIGGLSSTVTGEGLYWTAAREMDAGDTDGNVSFAIDYMDQAGNEGIQDTETTDFSNVRFDNTPPTLTSVSIESDNFYDSTLAKVADEVIISFSTSEIVQLPVVTIDGDTAYVAGSDSVWTAVLSMTETDTEGELAFTIDYMDLAGNNGLQGTETSDASGVRFDRTLRDANDINGIRQYI